MGAAVVVGFGVVVGAAVVVGFAVVVVGFAVVVGAAVDVAATTAAAAAGPNDPRRGAVKISAIVVPGTIPDIETLDIFIIKY